MTDNVSLCGLIGEAHRLEDLEGGTPERVIDELLAHLDSLDNLGPEAIELIRRAILAREREATTGIGNGIAIPHMKNCPCVQEIRGIFGRSREGVEYGSTDGERVHLFFLIVTPEGGSSVHVQAMKKIVRLSRDRKTMQYLINVDTFANLDAILKEIDDHPE